MTVFGSDRPGIVVQGWLTQCEICESTHWVRGGYDEASIWLTRHLDDNHPGWDTPLPEIPGFYAVADPRDDGSPAVVELLNSPKGQWGLVDGVTYLSVQEVRALGPLYQLVIARQVQPCVTLL